MGQSNDPREGPVAEQKELMFVLVTFIAPTGVWTVFTVAGLINYSSQVNNASSPDKDETVVSNDHIFWLRWTALKKKNLTCVYHLLC